MAAILRIMIPAVIDDSKLTSSTVPETDYAVWNSGTTYALGARCIKNHRIFESQVATGNINKDPVDPVNQFGTIVYWLDIGPTNRYAMFDGYISTPTVATTSMTVVLHAGAANMIYLDGLEGANTLTVSVKDAPGGSVILSGSYSLRGNRPSTYWQYWFNAFLNVKSKIIPNIPPYTNMEFTITLSGATGATIKCGVLGVGMVKSMGRTQQGAEAKPKNYGYVKTDQYGNNTYKVGKKAIDITGSAVIDQDEARQVQQMLVDAMGLPCMISCSDLDTYSGLNGFGFVTGKVTYKTPLTSEVSFTQEGVI